MQSVRQVQILRLIRDSTYVTIPEIAQRWQISFATARRDVDHLAGQGVIRLHGGARLGAGTSIDDQPATRGRRRSSSADAALVRHAARMVSPRMSVGICAGTHDLAIARAIARMDGVSVVTNSIRAAETIWSSALYESRSSSVLLTPGAPNRSGRLDGPLCVRALEGFSLNITFASVGGYDANRSSFTDDADSVEVFQAFRASSVRMLLLADGRDWAATGPVLLGAPRRGDVLVADISAAQRHELGDTDCQVIWAA